MYSKDQLLDICRSSVDSRSSQSLISGALTEGWTPGVAGTGNNGGWSRKDEVKDGQMGADICWDFDGSVQPLGFIDMGEEEKEVREYTTCWFPDADNDLVIYHICQLSTQASSPERHQGGRSDARDQW